jgi:hypothetical protein
MSCVLVFLHISRDLLDVVFWRSQPSCCADGEDVCVWCQVCKFSEILLFVLFRHSEPSVLMSRMSVWRHFWTFSEIFNFVVFSEPSCTDGEDVYVW